MQKVDLQPDCGVSWNHLAVDECVIRIDDQQYWPYVFVDPATNQFLHIRLFQSICAEIVKESGYNPKK